MVGAGVLALPIVTKPAGFLPSSAALLVVWAYMAGTALLITELSLSAVCSLGRPSGVSILSLGRITLGPVGGAATAVVYTFLHYAILTAYTAQGGAVLGELYTQLLHAPALPAVAPASLFALGIGGSLLVLPDPAVEALNNVLVGGVALSFVGVMASLAGGFDPSVLFSDSDVSAIPRAIPVMLVANVYHNIVGPVASRLEGDPFRIRRAILLGSAAPLGLFLAYNAAVLGSGVDPSSISAGPVQAFSLLAIATSFVGFVAGLVDLWADVRVSILREQPDAVQRQLWPSYAATVLPPVAFAAADPGIFLRALDFAGTYGIAVLFGFMPAAMAWRNREEVGGFPEMVPGGKPVLALMMAFPALVIAQKVFGH